MNIICEKLGQLNLYIFTTAFDDFNMQIVLGSTEKTIESDRSIFCRDSATIVQFFFLMAREGATPHKCGPTFHKKLSEAYHKKKSDILKKKLLKPTVAHHQQTNRVTKKH